MIISQYMPYGSLYDILHEGTGMYLLNANINIAYDFMLSQMEISNAYAARAS